MFAGNFAPRGWAFCNGDLLAVSANDALFSLLGTIYGGDGRTTFGLPDMRGRIPLHEGTGPGLSPRRLGSKGGAETVTLTTNQIPSHNHPMQTANVPPNQTTPNGHVLSQTPVVDPFYAPPEGDFTPMNTAAISNVGGSRSHNNLMPYLCINYIIALVGIYPSRQ